MDMHSPDRDRRDDQGDSFENEHFSRRSPSAALELAERLPSTPPDRASQIFNDLFSEALSPQLAEAILDSWPRKPRFLGDLSGLSERAASNLLAGLYGADEALQDNFTARYERYSKRRAIVDTMVAHPEIVAEPDRSGFLRTLSAMLLKEWELSLFAKHLARYDNAAGRAALAALPAEEVGKYFADPGSEAGDASRLLALLPKAMHDATLRHSFELGDWHFDEIMKKLNHLSLGILAEHIGNSMSNVPESLDRLRKFDIEPEGVRRVAAALEKAGKFDLIIERVNKLPAGFAEALEDSHRLRSYRDQVGVADVATYRNYCTVAALENPVHNVLPHWVERTRQTAALRMEHDLPANPYEAPERSLLSIVWEALRLRWGPQRS